MEAQEGTFTLVRRLVGQTVERELYSNGKLIYSDRMSEKMFIYRLTHLDILSALEQFSFGECGLYIGEHATNRIEKQKKNINNPIELFQFILLKVQKLNFSIKFFEFRYKSINPGKQVMLLPGTIKHINKNNEQ